MLRYLLYPFLIYRSFFLPFLVANLVVVPCWMLVRLLYRRSRTQPMSLRRELLLLTLVIYLAGVASATLAPNHGSRARSQSAASVELRPNLRSLTCSTDDMPRGSRERFFCAHNAAGNILLFIPLGILLPWLWPRLRVWRGLELAVALSVCIEVLQYLSRAWGSYRMADVNDVILNGAGACLGLTLVALLRLRRVTLSRAGEPDST